MKNAQKVLENNFKRKEGEIEALKSKLELREAEDDRHTIRDRQAFESHFNYKARPQEQKYLNFMKMYESQAAENRREKARLLQENSDLGQQLELQINGKDTNQYLVGKLSDKEEEIRLLHESLKVNADDLRDFLGEISTLRRQIQAKDDQLVQLDQELQSRPNMARANQERIKMEHLQQQVNDLEL